MRKIMETSEATFTWVVAKPLVVDVMVMAARLVTHHRGSLGLRTNPQLPGRKPFFH